MAESREVLTRSARAPDRVEAFGEHEHQVYDVYEPPTAASGTCVVLVHGGFWRAEHDRRHLYPMAAALAEQGHRVVLVEYRRTGMPGGGWPTTGLDVATAVQTVRDRECRPGLPVVLVGHSAGGHLALWLLHQPAGAGVAGAVSLAGCLDLALVRHLGLGDEAVADLMHGIPDSRQDIHRAADPARLGPAPAPVTALHGDADQIVPVAVSRSWWEQAARPGRDRLSVLDDVGHFALVDPAHRAFGPTSAAVIHLASRFAT
ncbi:MAG: alpha/beta hydrolase family protein [Ornithinimicrobium sp.]|uniref:alpha/beta hydrolase family protein n=1 Tax=Ornithinimicrobium sp. TaxID=1977084 RepID=UPI003D9B0A3E